LKHQAPPARFELTTY